MTDAASELPRILALARAQRPDPEGWSLAAHRRLGLASALVTEAGARMHRLGTGVARLHVNANNSRALAAWRRLGWRESGRRGRFERAVTAHPRANGRSAGIVAAPGLDST